MYFKMQLTIKIGALKFNECHKLCEVATEIFMRDNNIMSPQDLSQMALGMARIGYRPNIEFLENLETYYIKRYADFIPKSTSNIMCWMAKLRYLPSMDYLDAVEMFFIKNYIPLVTQNITNTIYSFSVFNVIPGERLLDIIYGYCTKHVKTFTVIEMCYLIQSLTHLNLMNRGLFRQMLERIFGRNEERWHEISNHEKLQLIQGYIGFCSNNKMEKEKIIPNEIVSQFKDYKQQRPNYDKYEIWHLFNKLKYPKEYVYIIDIMTLLNVVSESIDAIDSIKRKRSIAVAILSEGDYFWNQTEEIKGSKFWQIEVMENHGFNVIEIDLRKFAELEEEEKLNYLNEKIKIINTSEFNS